MHCTHCFKTREDLKQGTWNNLFIPGTKHIIEQAAKRGIRVANSIGEINTNPDLYGDYIALNGEGRFRGNSFVVKRTQDDLYFCDTFYRPYDEVCVAIAMLGTKLFQGKLVWSSDGEVEKEGYIKNGLMLFCKSFKITDYYGVIRSDLVDIIEKINFESLKESYA